MNSRRDHVAVEDVLLFANAAITNTGQREFRSTAAEQRMSLDFVHEYMAGNYREIYAAVLALDINDHNASMVIQRLLETAGEAHDDQRRREGELIARRLTLLPPQRVYRLFRALRRAKVNNRRTRAIMRDWIGSRPDAAFDAVKYRSGVKSAVRHTHLRPTHPELGAFLFAPHTSGRFETPILDAWRRAHYEHAAIYELPYTAAEGFAAKHQIRRDVFLQRITPRLTQRERLRLQGATVPVELDRVPLTRLATFVLSLSLDERARRRAELTEALRSAAARAAGTQRGTWGTVAAVLDDSFSTFGSTHKRRRPLAVALASHHLLAALATRYVPLWTSGRTDALLTYPSGATPLGMRLLDALEVEPDRIVIVSDGWDNAPPGLAAEVLRVWRARLDPDARTTIVHLNPVFDVDDFDVRRLSATVPTVGIRDAEDLPSLLELAQFGAGRTTEAQLTAHLEARAQAFLAAS